MTGAAKTSLASYLFARLKQAGVSHVHGVPGDFTLKALDRLRTSGVRFVGCCNELNAGYAADGYARAQRWMGHGQLGALFTTYGVGELSAANAIAGSFAEHVPVVHIVGTPSRHVKSVSATTLPNTRPHLHIHHTMGDGRTNAFRQIAERFTIAQLDLGGLTPEDAQQQIDWILLRAMETSLPVYIELPIDAVDTSADTAALSRPLVSREVHGVEIDISSSSRSAAAQTTSLMASQLLQRLYSSERPVILVDRADGMDVMRHSVNDFVAALGFPTLALPSGAGMVDNSLDNYYGIHAGIVGHVDTTPFVQSADLVLAFGPQFSDTQTLGWEIVPERENMVILGRNHIDGTPVEVKEVLQQALADLDKSRLPETYNTQSLGNFRHFNLSRVDPAQHVNQTDFYKRLSPHLKANDTIILGNATPILGGRDFVLPPSTQVIASGMWFSIGQMLPAALGVAQAKSKAGLGRTILLDGDGSFQVTAQELSTIIRDRQNCIIFIVNNGGYTYERLIHGRDEEYNEIAPWDYLAAPRLFAGSDSARQDGYAISTHRVRTWGELDEVLISESFRNGKGLTLVDLHMDKFDIPEKANAVFKRVQAVV